jgi:3',5'-cyclic AMP phosphodiesterase CpdA
MKVILHLSDLHFGRVDERFVAGVSEAAAAIRPDIVAVSGDLTQRARAWQFRAAREFLDSLPGERIVVPGNHDVPLYNVLARFGSPLQGFRAHITPDLVPFLRDDEIAMLGANTTRSFTIKDGGFRPRDLRTLSQRLASLDRGVVKVVVCHHPFDAPAGRLGRLTTPWPAADAMSALVAAGADVFLTGHLHRSYTGGTAHRYRAAGTSAIVVEAGTATSTRQREQPNSFNVLRVDRDTVAAEQHDWDERSGRFERVTAQRFVSRAEGWEAADNPSDRLGQR